MNDRSFSCSPAEPKNLFDSFRFDSEGLFFPALRAAVTLVAEKHRFFLLCLALAGAPWQALGQGPGEVGQCSLTLVNALPGPKNLYVKFGAEVIWPSGFTPGQSTGAALFPSGKKTVELTCEGFARTQTEILMPAGGNFAMIFFPGEEMKEGPDKGKKKIGVYCPPPILPGQPPKGKNWKILLVGPVVQTEVSVNSKSMELKMGQPVEIASEGGRVLVENGNKTLLATSPEGEGNYWAIIFGDSKESLQAAYLNHVAYSVPK